MKLFRFLFVIALIVSFCEKPIAAQTPAGEATEPVDETIVQEKIVTFSQKIGVIKLHLSAKSWYSPIKWRLTISIDNVLIYEHYADDTEIDLLFNDLGFVQGCKSYIGCKKKYYGQDILSYLISTRDFSINPHVFDKKNLGSIHHIAFDELVHKFKVNEAEAEKIVEKMIQRIKTGQTPILFVSESPVLSYLPKIFVDEVNSFVTVYRW